MWLDKRCTMVTQFLLCDPFWQSDAPSVLELLLGQPPGSRVEYSYRKLSKRVENSAENIERNRKLGNNFFSFFLDIRYHLLYSYVASCCHGWHFCKQWKCEIQLQIRIRVETYKKILKESRILMVTDDCVSTRAQIFHFQYAVRSTHKNKYPTFGSLTCWGHWLTWDLKSGCRSMRLVTADTPVFFPRSSSLAARELHPPPFCWS